MKFRRLAVSLMLAALPAAAQSPAPPSPSVNLSENAQKAQAIINQCIQALGGQAYLNMQDMQENGRAYGFYHNREEGAGTQFWLFWKAPDRERVELTKQRDVIEVHNGDQGYEITYKGTAAEDPKDHADYLRQRQHSLANVLRHWLPQPDVALFYDGRSFAENHVVDQVTVMTRQDQSVRLSLDAATHLPVRLSYTVRDPVSRDRDQYTEVYDNYQLVQGIQTPLNLTRSHNGEMTSQRFLNHASYNSGLPDSMFEAKVTYDPSAKKKH
jgi:hypothetical protein